MYRPEQLLSERFPKSRHNVLALAIQTIDEVPYAHSGNGCSFTPFVPHGRDPYRDHRVLSLSLLARRARALCELCSWAWVRRR